MTQFRLSYHGETTEFQRQETVTKEANERLTIKKQKLDFLFISQQYGS